MDVHTTVLLTVLDMLRAGGSYDDAPPWFAWASIDDRPVGAALRTPPYKVALSGMTADVARALGRELASHELPGGFGDLPTVAAFADAAGRRHAMRIHEIQYVQEAVVPPPPVPGTARHYVDTDADLYVRWEADFAAEAGVRRSADPLGSLRSRITHGRGAVAVGGRRPARVDVRSNGPGHRGPADWAGVDTAVRRRCSGVHAVRRCDESDVERNL